MKNLKECLLDAVKQENNKHFNELLARQRQYKKEYMQNLKGVKRTLYYVLNRKYELYRINQTIKYDDINIGISSSGVKCYQKKQDGFFYCLRMEQIRCYNSLNGLVDLYNCIK